MFKPGIETSLREKRYKRPFDLAVIILTHLLFLPVWILAWTLIPLAIWVESRGPIFYSQNRAGKNGKIFKVLKFRSLVVNAESSVRGGEFPTGTYVTRVGKILRPTGLDELPQILNIFKGEMSLVGPRALPDYEQAEITRDNPDQKLRLLVRPGLTGLHQIYTGASRDNSKRLPFDVAYIEQMSPLLDMRLIFAAVWYSILAQWDGRNVRESQVPTSTAYTGYDAGGDGD